MIQRKVLLAEDDLVSASLLRTILGSAGFEVACAENGQKALDLFLEHPFSVVVTDIAMPELTGLGLIEAIRAHGHSPVIIVQTAVDEVSSVIEIMKTGVYDYVVKPINQGEFLHKVENAFEIAELREVEKALVQERELRITHQLTNRNLVEKILTRDYDKFDKELFTNLKTSFSQGAGFGGLLALISLISVQAKKENGKYIIDEELMNLILQNAQMGQRAIEAFSDIEFLINEKFDLQPMKMHELSTVIHEEVAALERFAQIKKTPIKMSDQNLGAAGKTLQMDIEKFKKAFKEVLINAMRFSVDGSPILLLFNQSAKHLFISVLNKPIPSTESALGIPPEYARMVFEPFFRLTRTVDERYDTLEFGLGLTMVGKVIQKLFGKITAGNVTDYLEIGEKGAIRVNIEIELPFI